MALASVVVLGAVSIAQAAAGFPAPGGVPLHRRLHPLPGRHPGRERAGDRAAHRGGAGHPGRRAARSSATATPTRSRSGVTFDWGRDVNLLRMEVKEKIDQIRGELPARHPADLPADLQHQRHPHHRGTHLGQGPGPVRELGPDRPEDHRARCSAFPGVGRVNIDGVLPTQASVYLRFDKIMEHDVDVNRLFRRTGGGQRRAHRGPGHRPRPALRPAHGQRPARRGGSARAAHRRARAAPAATWPRSSTARRPCSYGRHPERRTGHRLLDPEGLGLQHGRGLPGHRGGAGADQPGSDPGRASTASPSSTRPTRSPTPCAACCRAGCSARCWPWRSSTSSCAG